MRLKGKSVIVTGAGQGIGRAIARAMAAEGASVLVNDIVAGKARGVADEIAAEGGRAEPDGSDIATFSGAKATVEAAAAAFGGVDILVNNAGVLRDRMSFNMSEEEWDAVLAVCLKGTFACAKFASRKMKEQGRGGRIINVSSRSGLRGNVGQANYAAAKAGVLGFTRTISQELSKYAITVNAIVPRAETAMIDSIPKDVKAAKDSGWSGSSVRKRGTADEVAPAAVYLALDDSDWITGQVVGIGGDKLSLWSHPTEVAEAFVFGGWDVDKMQALFRASVGHQLQSVGNKD